MKIGTVERLMRNITWWDTPTHCNQLNHHSASNCTCQVPKNWVFPYDVHKTYETIRKKQPGIKNL